MKSYPQTLRWYWRHRRNILWAIDLLVRVHTSDSWLPDLIWEVSMGALPDHYIENSEYIAAWRIMRKCVGKPV